jgi:hypothetical protein
MGWVVKDNSNLTNPTITTPTITGGTINNTVIGATTPAAGTFKDVNADGNMVVTSAAKTLVLKQGANGKTGTVTINGTSLVTAANTSITANSNIILTLKTGGGTVGTTPSIKSITAGVQFVVAGVALDTSTYNYAIIESA